VTKLHALMLAMTPLALSICLSTYLLRLEKRLSRLEARRAAVLGDNGPMKVTLQAAQMSAPRPASQAGRRVRGLLGMDPDRAQPYKTPAAVVFALAIVPGLAAQWLVHGLLGPAAWGLVPAGWLFTVRTYYRGADAKRRSLLLRQFPDALGTVVRAVRVGIPVTEAMRAVAQDAPEPTASEFGRVHDQVSIGTALEDALLTLAQRSRLPEYRFFATALSLQSQTGGGLSETLESLADVIRKRVALQARGYALAAEARTSAGVLAVLPLLTGGALGVLRPDYISPLFQEGPGQMLLGVAVLWLSAGLLVMRWMIVKSVT
jgi:tight adherence protein B